MPLLSITDGKDICNYSGRNQMLFNSLQFAVFLPIVFISYWLLPHKYRWLLLLIASYYFYMSWNAKYVVLILFTTAVSYFAAILIEKTENVKSRKIILAFTLIACLGVLFAFKYYNFFSSSLTALLEKFAIPLHPVTLKLLLPVGISFYTFQTLSYVIDVYKGRVKAERHFGIYACFISFFPQLVAGPIERTENLLPQIKAEHNFDYSQAMLGLKIMLWGYFKKMVISDNLAIYVDGVFDNLYSYQGFSLVIAVLFFTLQIYCDFSGYSDIARGTAKLMGIELMENFKCPYFSTSVKEFWRRWHISLSTWFKDYLYIPLGGNRVSKLRNFFNVMVTFLVSGLWHGANWTFVIWGGLHGLAQFVESLLGLNGKNVKRGGVSHWLRVCVVFTFVALAWIMFRAQSFTEAMYVFSNMFAGITEPVNYIYQGLSKTGLGYSGALQAGLLYVVPLFVYDYISFKNDEDGAVLMSAQKPWIQWLIYIVMGCLIIMLSPKGAAAEFVYFQF
jgi:D-alanyl-lipoteichoic acid acyltransferase DltB (MBOAT superfamily)